MSSLLKDSELSVTETSQSVVGRRTVAIFPRSLYEVWCKKLFSDIVAFDRNSEHREALLPPGPYEPSGINNILPFNSEDPEGAQSTFEIVRAKPLKNIVRVYFIEILYNFKTLRKRAALALLPPVPVKK